MFMKRNKQIHFRATEKEQTAFKKRKLVELVRDILALPYKEYEKVKKYVERLKDG